MSFQYLKTLSINSEVRVFIYPSICLFVLFTQQENISTAIREEKASCMGSPFSVQYIQYSVVEYLFTDKILVEYLVQFPGPVGEFGGFC